MSECSDGASAIENIALHSPEIAVLDAQLADMSAHEIVQAVRAKNQTTKIIVLGATSDRGVADRFLTSGADAYIVRSGPSRYLNDAIRYVRDGGKYLAPQLTTEQPVTAAPHSHLALDPEAVSNLHLAIEAQARIVDRLEHAMDRAQQAIEILQQRVEQLSGSPIETSPADSEEKSQGRRLPGFRSTLGTVAAALIVGIIGFQLSGILRPPPASPLAEFSSAGAEDALKAGTTGSLHLAGWESETVANAAALLKNQQFAASEKLCRALLKQDPANTAASRVLASALFHQNRVEESADVVRSMSVPAARPGNSSPRLSFDN